MQLPHFLTERINSNPLRKRRIIDRRRLFEYVKALVVGGMCPAWVGGFFMTEASAAEQSERLPAFEFLGHHIGDRLQEKFSFPSQDGSWTSREKGEPYCIADTSENVTCHGDLKIWNGSGYTVGGVSVDLTYGFLNLKLHSLIMTFDGSSHNKIREMLIAKYGKLLTSTPARFILLLINITLLSPIGNSGKDF